MPEKISAVLEYGASEPAEALQFMQDKLNPDIIVIDARSRDAYRVGHIPGARSFPHREMSPDTTAQLGRAKVYVVYCDGIGCNASTKGAYNLARLGFRVKELLGGLDWWRRDGNPIEISDQPGTLRAEAAD
jgi:rhodanese-related sulfurtransferase